MGLEISAIKKETFIFENYREDGGTVVVVVEEEEEKEKEEEEEMIGKGDPMGFVQEVEFWI